MPSSQKLCPKPFKNSYPLSFHVQMFFLNRKLKKKVRFWPRTFTVVFVKRVNSAFRVNFELKFFCSKKIERNTCRSKTVQNRDPTLHPLTSDNLNEQPLSKTSSVMSTYLKIALFSRLIVSGAEWKPWLLNQAVIELLLKVAPIM